MNSFTTMYIFVSIFIFFTVNRTSFLCLQFTANITKHWLYLINTGMHYFTILCKIPVLSLCIQYTMWITGAISVYSIYYVNNRYYLCVFNILWELLVLSLYIRLSIDVKFNRSIENHCGIIKRPLYIYQSKLVYSATFRMSQPLEWIHTQDVFCGL